MADAIICGYALDNVGFKRLIEETPPMREMLPSLEDSPVILYDRWRSNLPRRTQKDAPKVRCKRDGDTPLYLFASRHTPYKGKRQLERLQASSGGFLQETERDKTKLRLWIAFIKGCGGPQFGEEDFRFDWTVDQDPAKYDF